MIAVVELEEEGEAVEPRSLELPPVVGMLERAEEFQRLVMSGIVASRTELARRYGLTRARVTQLMNLLELHPAVLAYVRSLSGGTAPRLVTERKLRRLTRLSRERQIDAAIDLLPGFADFVGFAVHSPDIADEIAIGAGRSQSDRTEETGSEELSASPA